MEGRGKEEFEEGEGEREEMKECGRKERREGWRERDIKHATQS